MRLNIIKYFFFRQQQQLERVKKWLQLRNRDIDHRTQVEERRKKREEEAKAYADKGYQGLPGSLLKNFADLIGLPYQAATNVILEQARLLREIDTGVANLRMAKYTITARDTVPEMLVKRDDIILQITSLASKLS